MREPCIAWWPGRIKAGVVSASLLCTLDLFPTVAKLTGGEVPQDRIIDGLDMSGVLLKGTPGPRRSLFYYRGTRLFAARRDHWKLHLFTQKGYGQANPDAHDPPLLFDLNSDPAERFNVSADHPEIVAEILKDIAAHRATVQAVDSQLESVKPADRP
jgi:arylsulfatase A-like enzyme